jgi:glycosyltransferase
MHNNLPLVSVIMITYGHEKYIQKAIEGVFLQKTNFPIEFIIANDCSPDNTDELVKEIIKKSPPNIQVRYTKHEANKGMNPNFIWAYQQALGKYVAVCEGDDYWTDENKLQKQVDFLEQNPDYSVSCHNIFLLNGDTLSSESPYDKENTQETYTLNDLASRNLIPTLSVVFRYFDINFSDWYLSSPMGDYPLMLWIAQKGKIKYFKEKMAVYRQNVGVWSGKKINYENSFIMFDGLIEHFKDNTAVKKNLKKHKDKYIKAMLYSKSFSKVIKDKNWKELGCIDKLKALIKSL